ncbi:hypothetical protein SRABI04_02079 [Chryseobacterium sp. Bi04]|nr:hypothetical protein SRABI04_02079 [Chryseobacterium sp. Bi04]
METGNNRILGYKTTETMKKLFLLLLTAFLFIGCSSDDDTIYDYIGTWSGTYDGSDKGVWNIVVDNAGKVTGTMHSDVNNENYNISGNLSTSGDLNAVVGLPSKGDFRGTLNTDKKGNGNWSNSLPTPAKSGSWKGDKK